MPITLATTLEKAGKTTELIHNPDGSRVLLLPHGGRVLGLFTKNSDENFYWTHDALSLVKTATEFYKGDHWQNSGGDRTWLSPEVDLFFPDFPSLDKYWQPRELDPGHYQIVRSGHRTALVNELSVTLSRTKRNVRMKITKSVGQAPSPLRFERDFCEDVEYAGYTQFTSLELLGKSKQDDVRVGLWNLVQMPHGGDLLVPTYVKALPKVYLGNITPRHLVVEENLLRFKMRLKGEHKLGIRAVSTAGRVGYLYQSSQKNRWALIIRNFLVNPSGEYIDVPWSDPEDYGYSTQACNVNSGLGKFSELEYHIPAIGKSTGRVRCDDAAQVWAFRGPLPSIRKVGGLLLTSKM